MLFGRRLTFALLVLASQLLLIALAINWCFHLLLIAKYGQVYSVERNGLVLHAEITAILLVILFAIIVFVLQCKRLWEKRQGEEAVGNGLSLRQNTSYSPRGSSRLKSPPASG
jgi:hypothetical protein